MQRTFFILLLTLVTNISLANGMPVVKAILPKIFNSKEIVCERAEIIVNSKVPLDLSVYRKAKVLKPAPMEPHFQISVDYINPTDKPIKATIGFPFDKECIYLLTSRLGWKYSQLKVLYVANKERVFPRPLECDKYSRVWGRLEKVFLPKSKVQISYDYNFFGWGGASSKGKNEELSYLGFITDSVKSNLSNSSRVKIVLNFANSLDKKRLKTFPQADVLTEQKIVWEFAGMEIPSSFIAVHTNWQNKPLKQFFEEYTKNSLSIEANEIAQTKYEYIKPSSITVSEEELQRMIDNPNALDVLKKSVWEKD